MASKCAMTAKKFSHLRPLDVVAAAVSSSEALILDHDAPEARNLKTPPMIVHSHGPGGIGLPHQKVPTHVNGIVFASAELFCTSRDDLLCSNLAGCPCTFPTHAVD